MKYNQLCVLALMSILGWNVNCESLAWVLEKKLDPFSDATDIIASVQSNEPNRGYILAKCANSELELYISVGKFIGGSHNRSGRYVYARMRYRVDSNKVIETKWSVVGDRSIVKAVAEDIVMKRLMKGETIVVEIEDFQKVAHRASYTLKGSRIALGAVLERCGFPT